MNEKLYLMTFHYDLCDRYNIFSCRFLLTLQQNTDTQNRSEGNQTLNLEYIFLSDRYM